MFFGTKVMTYADESLAIEHLMLLQSAYSTGRKDVIHLLDEGKVTLEQLVKTELEIEMMQKHPNPLKLAKQYNPGDKVELLPEDYLGLSKDYDPNDIF